jgi:hypothetical protein
MFKAKMQAAAPSETEQDMRTLIEAIAPVSPGTESRYRFEELVHKVRDLGLFDHQAFRFGRRDVDLYRANGEANRAARSLFGKLFAKFDHYRFVSPSNRIFEFLMIGNRASRCYHVVVVVESQAG